MKDLAAPVKPAPASAPAKSVPIPATSTATPVMSASVPAKPATLQFESERFQPIEEKEVPDFQRSFRVSKGSLVWARWLQSTLPCHHDSSVVVRGMSKRQGNCSGKPEKETEPKPGGMEPSGHQFCPSTPRVGTSGASTEKLLPPKGRLLGGVC